nr:hypothetical protein [Archaeoglobus sp.]
MRAKKVDVFLIFYNKTPVPDFFEVNTNALSQLAGFIEVDFGSLIAPAIEEIESC